MLSTIHARLGVAVIAVGMLLAAGCGGSGEQSYSEQEVKTPSASEQLRAWLQSVAESGQLDSGAEVMKDKVNALEVPNKSEIAQEYEKLLGMKSPAQIKTQANKMLGMLPMT